MAEPSLADRKCIPCDEGGEPLKGAALAALARQVPDWEVVEERRLKRQFDFGDFRAALAFVNQVADLAELLGHHPWFHFTWGKVILELWTHKVGGLLENDFILAAKIDRLWQERATS